jgi:nucleoside phosphorylase
MLDVGIVTMKEEEYEALLKKVRPTATHRGANRDYDVAAVATPHGPCRVGITRCIQQGNAHAQNAATEMLADVSPAFVLVVGIAGGIPTSDFCLGDVVVSDYIQDLALEDTGTAPAARRFNALGGPLHPSATRIVERLRSLEALNRGWSSARSIGCRRPGPEGEHTTEDAAWNAEIDRALLAQAVKRNQPRATARKIASSDRLVKDPVLVREWRGVLKAVAAVEMESAGVYVACQRQGVPFLAIRGISDIIGWKRDEAWTLYACHAVASYTRMLIASGAFRSARRVSVEVSVGDEAGARAANLVTVHGDVGTVVAAARDVSIRERGGHGDP